MIVIRVELWPCGDRSRAQDLGEARITNTAPTLFGDRSLGDYRVELLKGARYSRRPGEIWRWCTVRAFPRRALGPWDLLHRALGQMLGGRNSRPARCDP